MPHTVAIILARMGSSRLLGKSLAPVIGKPLIVHIIERLQNTPELNEVVLATPDTTEDQPLQQAGRDAGATVFAGAEEDVLDRLYQAAKNIKADTVVHVGGDCPFVDPAHIKQALELLHNTGADYTCNILPMTYPAGMDIDALTFLALEKAWTEAEIRTVRRHPLTYIYQNKEAFHIENFVSEPNLAHLRWTLDYEDDLTFVQQVYENLYPQNPKFGMDAILNLLKEKPEIGAINEHLSDYVSSQPAYWDSEGYMTDLRIDLCQVVQKATEADKNQDLETAAQQYQLAQKLLHDLSERATALSTQTENQ